MNTEERLAQIRHDIDFIDYSGLGHGEPHYNPNALVALDAARSLLAIVGKLDAEIARLRTENAALAEALDAVTHEYREGGIGMIADECTANLGPTDDRWVMCYHDRQDPIHRTSKRVLADLRAHDPEQANRD